MALPSFTCANPAAACASAPDLAFLNAQSGCLVLNGPGSSGACVPAACSTMPCGNVCPTPCAVSDSDGECLQHLAAQQTPASSCLAFRRQMMLRLLQRQPLAGCTGACAAGGSSDTGCCVAPADADSAFDATRPADPWQLNDAVNGGVAAAVTYQNFLNATDTCMLRQCECPLPPNPANGECNGHGVCTRQTGTAGSDEPLFACVCENAYIGAACETATAQFVCPSVFDDATGQLVPCGGATHGRCNAKYECECEPSWGGDNCSVRTCASVANQVCNGAGTCVGGSQTCACNPGFSGPACNCTVDAAGKRTCATVDGASPPPVSTPGTRSIHHMFAGTAPQAIAKLKLMIAIVGSLILVAVAIGLFFWLRSRSGPSPPSPVTGASSDAGARFRHVRR